MKELHKERSRHLEIFLYTLTPRIKDSPWLDDEYSCSSLHHQELGAFAKEWRTAQVILKEIRGKMEEYFVYQNFQKSNEVQEYA
jgi:hypothetical protein